MPAPCVPNMGNVGVPGSLAYTGMMPDRTVPKFESGPRPQTRKAGSTVLSDAELAQLAALPDEDIYELYEELEAERGLPPAVSLTPEARRSMVSNAAASLKAQQSPPRDKSGSDKADMAKGIVHPNNSTVIGGTSMNQEEFKSQFVSQYGPSQGIPCFDSVDVNKDGVIDRSEFETLMASMMKQPAPRLPNVKGWPNKPGASRQAPVGFPQLSPAGSQEQVSREVDDSCGVPTTPPKVASMASPDDNKTTKLLAAAKTGAAWEISELVSAKANLNSSGPDGKAPIHIGAMFGQVTSIAALCQAKADVNITNSYGRGPLHLAARHGQLEAIRLLLEDPGATQRIRLNELNAVSA